MYIKFQSLEFREAMKSLIFSVLVLFQQERLRFILTHPQGIVLAEFKMLQGLKNQSFQQHSLLLEVAPGLIIILVAYKALINTL